MPIEWVFLPVVYKPSCRANRYSRLCHAAVRSSTKLWAKKTHDQAKNFRNARQKALPPMRWEVRTRQLLHSSWVELVVYVTINDISVIYVTAHICAGGLKKKLDLRSGSQRHRHFVGFFNVPIQAPTRNQPFHTDTSPQLVAFYDTLGIRRTRSRLNPQALTGVCCIRYISPLARNTFVPP